MAFKFISYIHGLWSSSISNSFPPAFKKILELNTDEIRRYNENQPVIVQSGVWEKELSLFSQWLSRSREMCYQYFATLTDFGTCFYTSSLPNTIMVSLFADVDSLTTYHWHALVNSFIKNLILNCPNDCMQPILGPLLPPLFSCLTSKLKAAWVNADPTMVEKYD